MSRAGPENFPVPTRLEDAEIDRAVDPTQTPMDTPITQADLAAALTHAGLVPSRAMPEALRARLLAEAGARGPLSVMDGVRRPPSAGVRSPEPPDRRWIRWSAVAAVLLAAVGLSIWALHRASVQSRAVQQLRAQLAEAQEREAQNAELLRNADSAVQELLASLEDRESALNSQRAALAEAAARSVELARRLAEATARLGEAELTIARYEAPQDPAALAEDRTLLLEVPDTIRIAWSPFALPDAPPPVRPGVTGDVVWNDRLQTGYLRFVGLDPNDPKIEQYQVWVIDERGMEQKVSGGVFDVTDDGEIVVPIEPGIPVGRVALFAVTVEDPGGTWVPDLRRRVVVAPREGG